MSSFLLFFFWFKRYFFQVHKKLEKETGKWFNLVTNLTFRDLTCSILKSFKKPKFPYSWISQSQTCSRSVFPNHFWSAAYVDIRQHPSWPNTNNNQGIVLIGSTLGTLDLSNFNGIININTTSLISTTRSIILTRVVGNVEKPRSFYNKVFITDYIYNAT